MDWKTIL